MNLRTNQPGAPVIARGTSGGIHVEVSDQLSLSLFTERAPLLRRLMVYADRPVLPKDVRQFLFEPRVLDWHCIHRTFPVYGEMYCWHRHLLVHVYSLTDPTGHGQGSSGSASAWWEAFSSYREGSSRKQAASLVVLAAVGCTGPAGEAHKASLRTLTRWLIGDEAETPVGFV